MDLRIVLGISILTQLTAACLAFVLIRITRHRLPWVFLIAALLLMVSRRAITLYRVMSSDTAYAPDPVTETVAAAISVSLLIGLALLIPLFRRMRAAADLHRKSEEQFRQLADATSEGIVVHENGIILDVNRAFANMVGLPREKLIRRSVSDFVAPDSQEIVLRNIANNYSHPYQCSAMHRDGHTIPVEVCGRSKEYDGRTVRVSALRDLTEQREAEAALRESRRALTTLLGNLPGMAYRCRNDRQWTMEFCSEGSRALTGFAPGDLQGNAARSYGDLIHEADRDAIWSQVQAALAANEPFQLEYRIRTVDGDERWVWEQAVGIRDAVGEVVAIEGFICDITDRRLAAATLQQAHDELEHRVNLRTAALSTANENLVQEIQERTAAERALRESEQLFRSLTANAPVGIFLTDAEGMCIYANPRLLALCELSMEESLGRGWCQVIHPDDRQRVMAEIEQSYTGQVPFHADFRIQTGSGTVHWIDIHTALIPDDEGQLRGRVGIVEDITEQRRMAAALVESEARAKAIIDNSPAVIYVKDLDGRYININRRYTELFHHTLEELQGKTDYDIFPRTVADAVRANDRKVLEKAAPIEFEETVPHDDETHIYISLKFPLFDANCKPYAVCGISTDITDRKRNETALRESKEKLAALAQEQQTLLEHTRDIFYRHDAHGIFEYVSPSIEQITGYPAEVWQKHYAQFLTDNPINRNVVAHTEEALRTGQESPAYMLEVRHKKGHAIVLEVNERPFFDNGKVAGIIGVARDVTERFWAEIELKAAMKQAEAASRAKSVLLANVSHEIRTPIMAMLGAAELSGRAGEPEDAGLNYQDIIMRNGRHLLSLVDDLLDVARLEANKLDIRLQPCSLVEILADVQAITVPQRRNPKVDFRTIFETPIPSTIQTDPTRLKQAIINLVNNALKFTLAGHVHIRIRVNRDSPEPRLMIIVEDTGIGIPQDGLERIFQTFAQLDPAPVGLAEGLGLGLPIARGIAEQLGGTLEVTSTPGMGTSFTLSVCTGPLEDVTWQQPADLTLDGSATSMTRASATSPVPNVRLHGRVLLAEDFADTRELMERALVDAGAKVVAVEDGQEAIDAVAEAGETGFDLILLDIRMPRMDGLTAAAELRRRGCRSAIIAVTASTDPSEQRHIEEAGFDDVWRKPISLERLLAEASAYLAAAPDADRESDRSGAQKASTVRAGSTPAARGSRFAEAVSDFAQSLDSRMARLRKHVDAGDNAGARELLHQLVGAGGIHGFMELSAESARLMALAKKGVLCDQPDVLDALERLVKDIRKTAITP